jgi:hypothetical protein
LLCWLVFLRGLLDEAQVLLCDCCGAALHVAPAASSVRCEFCGALSVIHRPEAKGDAPRSTLRYLPATPPPTPRPAMTRPPPAEQDHRGTAAWGVLGAVILFIVVTLLSALAVFGAVFLAILFFLIGTLVFVSAHYVASQSNDVCESRPVEARPRSRDDDD